MTFEYENNLLIASLSGTKVGSLTFSELQEKVYNIDSVFVNPAYRGQGVAKQLVSAFVADCKVKGFFINPVCSYAVKEFETNEEYKSIRYIQN